MTTNRNAFQQVFSLSMVSSFFSTNTSDTEVEIQSKFEQVVFKSGYLDEHVGPNWELAWGPAVWRNKPNSQTPPDNVWLVAKNQHLDIDGTQSCTYVVAIAPTTGNVSPNIANNSYDWNYEDLDVWRVTDLKAWLAQDGGVLSKPPISLRGKPTQILFSHGTAQGVYNLISNPPASTTSPNPNTRLGDFLKSLNPTPGTKLIFTGHSLGGALSPALAAVLHEAGYLTAFKDIRVYPTAGASPGNAQFVNLYTRLFPPGSGEGYQVWNRNIVNTLDVVPHAWSTQDTTPFNLNAIASLYGTPDPLLSIDINLGVGAFIVIVDLIGRPYQPIPNSPFTWTKPPSIPTSFAEFERIATQQHMQAYFEEILQVQNLPPLIASRTSLVQQDVDLASIFPIINHMSYAASKGPLGNVDTDPE